MANLIFPDTVKLLEDPSIWIGDTAATLHMTPHAAGMVPNNSDKLNGKSSMVGNGKKEVTSMSGSINGQMIDMNRMEVVGPLSLMLPTHHQ